MPAALGSRPTKIKGSQYYKLYLRCSEEPIQEDQANSEEYCLLFFKFYNPNTQSLTLSMDAYVSTADTIDSLVPRILAANSLPANTVLTCNEELKAGRYPAKDATETFFDAGLQDGDILVFGLPPAEDQLDTLSFMANLHNAVVIEFRDLDKPLEDEAAFKLTLDWRMRYSDFITLLGEQLQHDPYHIQLTTPEPDNSQNRPLCPSADKIVSSTQCHLRSLLKCNHSEVMLPKCLFYQRTDLSIYQLERLNIS